MALLRILLAQKKTRIVDAILTHIKICEKRRKINTEQILNNFIQNSTITISSRNFSLVTTHKLKILRGFFSTQLSKTQRNSSSNNILD